MEDISVRLEEWKRKQAKLKIIEKVMVFIGFEYQKLGGEIFSDYIFALDDPATKEVLPFIDHLSKNNVKQDVHKDITLLIAHSEFLKELRDVRKDLLNMIKDLQPETHKEAPIPNVNS